MGEIAILEGHYLVNGKAHYWKRHRTRCVCRAFNYDSERTLVERPGEACDSILVETQSTRKTFAKLWDEYAAAVFEGVAPDPIQVAETRKAFYAGAYCFLTEQMVALDPGEEVTAADEAWLEALHDEIRVWLDRESTHELFRIKARGGVN